MRIHHCLLSLLLAGLPACNCGEGNALETAVPIIAVTTQMLVFDDTYVSASRELPLTIRNSGNDTLRDVRASITSGIAFAIGAPPALTVEPGREAEMRIVFLPQDPGSVEDTLTITSDAENAPSLTVRLVGKGLALPPCDDGNVCTADAFDVATERCEHVQRTGPCDDANACTRDDQCFEGVCRGTGVTCTDSVSCTTDACDATTGCRFIPDDTACEDDGNPCTIESCDPIEGCTRTDAADGTACGPLVQCQAIRVCVDAVCQPFNIPEGTQCFDGNPCTINDRCRMGACVGDGVEHDPGVVSRVPLFGAPFTQARILADGSIGLLDGAWRRNLLRPPPQRVQRGVVTILDGLLGVQARVDVDGDGLFLPAADGFALITSPEQCPCDPSVCSRCLQTWSVDGAAATQRGSLPLQGGVGYTVGVPSRAAWCASDYSHLVVVELSDLDNPVAVTHPVEGCVEVALSRDGQRALVREGGGGPTTGVVYDVTPASLTPRFTPSPALGALHLPAVGTTMIAGAAASPPAVELFSAVDGAFLGRHELTGGGVMGLAIDGNRVVVVRLVGQSYGLLLTLLDVTNPANILTLDEISIDNEGCGNCPKEVTFDGDKVLIHAEGKLQAFAVVGNAFESRTALGHGGGDIVEPRESGVYMLGSSAVQRAEVGADGIAALVAGRALRGQFAAYWVLPDVEAPRVVAGTSLGIDPRTFRLYDQFQSVLSAEEPHQQLGVVAVEPPEGTFNGRLTAGRLVDNTLYGLDMIVACTDAMCSAYEGRTTFFRAPVSGSMMMPAVPDLRVTVEVGPIGQDPSSIAVSSDASEAAAAVNDGPTSKIHLVRGLDGTPSVVSTPVLQSVTTSIAVEDGRVFAIEMSQSEALSEEEFRGNRLVVYEPGAAGVLEATSTLALPDSNHILLTAPPIALVSVADGLAFVRIDTPTPSLAFMMPLHEPPVTAAIRDDVLFLGQNASMTVAFPPCAP